MIQAHAMLTYTVLLLTVSHALAGLLFKEEFKVKEPPETFYESMTEYQGNPRVALLDKPSQDGDYTLSYADYHVTWEEFKITHNKHYVSIEEERMRYGIFMETVKLIEQHNWMYHNGHSSFYLGINHFSDLTDEEFRVLNGFNVNTTTMRTYCNLTNPRPSGAPDSIDWRDKGYVTAVKMQNTCGSCWSFSTTGAVEGQWFKKTGKLVSLSEQQLVDCSRAYGERGCHGGLADHAFEYVIDAGGLMAESDYKYEGKEGKCRLDKSKIVAKISRCYDIVPQDNEDVLKSAVGKIGPVSAGINADDPTFKSYKGGIYDNSNCPKTSKHAILIVGYGRKDGTDYWIVKNSWGAIWGEKGYALMARNKDNQCGIASFSSYPET